MSERALNYVRSLMREQVTAQQKNLLRIIADHHREQYGAAHVALDTLCDETLIERRNLRRMLHSLSSIVEYLPGAGRGNFGQFRFIALPVETPLETGVKRGLKGGGKGVFSAPAIRKKNLDQDQIQNQEHHASELSRPELARALNAWVKIKAQLKAQLPAADYDFWVRPMYLLRVAGDCMMLTVPPSSEVATKAKSSPLLQERIRAAGYSGGALQFYPDAWQLERMAELYPEAYAGIFDSLRKSVRAAS